MEIIQIYVISDTFFRVCRRQRALYKKRMKMTVCDYINFYEMTVLWHIYINLFICVIDMNV